MNYILMHRKIAVAELDIDLETAVILKIGDVFAPEHVPVGIGFINGNLNRGELNSWFKGRSIPASRQNIREALELLDTQSSEKLILKCYGLSLSDQYWFNPVDNPLDWEKINFFDNDFSEDVGDILFGNNPDDRNNLNLVTPDNTSDGWLKKRWKVINKGRYLIKGGSEPFFQEPFNEAMAAAVMNRLGIYHVPYDVITENKKPYSMCLNFIDSESDLVSALSIANTIKRNNNDSGYQHFLKCCAELGIPNVEENLQKMLVVDYLIANRDRHFNNFGAVRNAITLEWSGLAPVYDSGTSFWNNTISGKLSEFDKSDSKPFRSTHDEQIKLVTDFSWLDLSLLKGVEEDFMKIFSTSDTIDETRKNNICQAFNDRVEKLSDYIRNFT